MARSNGTNGAATKTRRATTSRIPKEIAGSQKKKGKTKELVITAPQFCTATFVLQGTAPYVQHKFGKKAQAQMHADQAAGSQKKKGKKRKAKDFEKCYEEAMHKSQEGWHGIPATAFRNAMIDACRLAGFHMTHAKCSVFIVADGFDPDGGTPLVKITKGKPHYTEMPVRLSGTTTDLRVRPMWDEWEAELRITWDGDQFSEEDVVNLLLRAGWQIGVGEGRPFSKNSAGMGWGTFTIKAGSKPSPR